MHGLIFASLRDYTIHRLGEERTAEIWGDRSFQTTEAYADEWFLAQLERLAAAAGETAAETEFSFGVFAAEATFAGLYPGYYAESGDTCAFLLGVEEKIHELVRATFPGATPPKLHVQRLGDSGVLVSYTSERGLCRLLAGLVHGTASHYGDRIELEELHAPRRPRLRLLGRARGRVSACPAHAGCHKCPWRAVVPFVPLEMAVAEPDTEAALKAYLIGLLSGTLAVLLVAVIWFGTRPPQEPGLLWGGTVYTSKQEFDNYLKSKGLSYKTFVARNPGVAPWEREEITVGAITVRASTKAREDWTVRLPLAAIGLMFATGCALLLSRRLRAATPGLARSSVALSAPLTILLRPVVARLAKGLVAFFSPRGFRIAKSAVGWPTAFAFIRRLGVVTSGATRRLRVSVTLYGERLIGAARQDARAAPELMRERNISVGYVAFGLLAALTAGVLAVFVVSLLSP